MTVHGAPDESRAARIILKDYISVRTNDPPPLCYTAHSPISYFGLMETKKTKVSVTIIQTFTIIY